jgi:hypothetical protein
VCGKAGIWRLQTFMLRSREMTNLKSEEVGFLRRNCAFMREDDFFFLYLHSNSTALYYIKPLTEKKRNRM